MSESEPTNPQTENQAETEAAPAFDPAKAEAEIAELKDKLLRTMADTENLRRRHEREREDTQKYAAGKFAKDILSVADNLRRALLAIPAGAEVQEPMKTLVAGIEATERELISVFERHAIQQVDPKGQKFDANLHQAMFEVDDPSQPAGTVVQVVAPGYTIAGRLLRAAMVGVSKGGPKNGEDLARVDTRV